MTWLWCRMGYMPLNMCVLRFYSPVNPMGSCQAQSVCHWNIFPETGMDKIWKLYLTCWIPLVGVDELCKLYLTYFSSHAQFSKLKHSCKWQSMTWPWPRQKVKLRKWCVLLTLTEAKGKTEERMCAIERSYPNVGVGQILKWYLEYFSSYKHFAKLKHSCKWQSMTWPWPRQKVKLRKGCVLLKGLILR